MVATKKRSVVKAVIWEVGMFCAITLLFYPVLGFSESLKWNAIALLLKTTGLYVYERVWNKIKWGEE